MILLIKKRGLKQASSKNSLYENKNRDEGDRSKYKANKLNENKRRAGKITITQALGDDTGRCKINSFFKKKTRKRKTNDGNLSGRENSRDVQIPDTPLTVQELANRMAERSTDLVKKLMTNGIMATKNQPIDIDTATLLVEELVISPSGYLKQTKML